MQLDDEPDDDDVVDGAAEGVRADEVEGGDGARDVEGLVGHRQPQRLARALHPVGVVLRMHAVVQPRHLQRRGARVTSARATVMCACWTACTMTKQSWHKGSR